VSLGTRRGYWFRQCALRAGGSRGCRALPRAGRRRVCRAGAVGHRGHRWSAGAAASGRGCGSHIRLRTRSRRRDRPALHQHVLRTRSPPRPLSDWYQPAPWRGRT